MPGPYGRGKEDQIPKRSGRALADMVNFYDFTPQVARLTTLAAIGTDYQW